jgi:tetratricopeptide (TPR) repeat protein
MTSRHQLLEERVSRHKKHHGSLATAPTDLRSRVQRAATEGRFQTALDLAKQLVKQDPTPQNAELLKTIQLGRARQLRSQGMTQDARNLLTNAAAQQTDPLWLEQAAEELARCGDPSGAQVLLNRVPNSKARPRVLAEAADAALAQGKNGRGFLPEDLRGQFDAVVQAFEFVENGQDEAGRAALQTLGLQSPFLEWKLLLRGLLAFYAQDDARAVEAFARLNPQRLPARLAAPFRFHLEPEFKRAQSPETQRILQKQGDQLFGSGLLPGLRNLQSALANERKLGDAFRIAETVLPSLKADAPALVPALANCCYRAIIDHGMPEDVARYKRVFGTPPDDPELWRLPALALERRDQLGEAHQCWLDYEKSIAKRPQTWPNDQAERVRALVWCHIGQNASALEEDGDEEDDFYFGPPRRRASKNGLKPGPDECFEKSIELAPDLLDAHTALFQYHLDNNRPGKAEKAARRLLGRFPQHVATLEALGQLLMKKQKYADALEFFRVALQVNPLERRLRAHVITAQLYKARDHAERAEFEEARDDYRAALAFDERKQNAGVLCKWAACEFKAGDAAAADDLLQKALAEKGERLAVIFSLLIEVIRLKLPRPLKTRFDREFNEALAQPANVEAACALIDTAATHSNAGITYVGQKTHEKKVLAYVERLSGANLSEAQLVELIDGVQAIGSNHLERKLIAQGLRRFPQSPWFPLAQAREEIAKGPRRCRGYLVRASLERARQLAEALPRDPRQQEVLAEIDRQMEELEELNPYGFFGRGGGFFGQMFGGLDDPYGPEDDEW